MIINENDLKISSTFLKAKEISKKQLEISQKILKEKLNKNIEASLFVKTDLYFYKVSRLQKNPYVYRLKFLQKNFKLKKKEAYKVLFRHGDFEPNLVLALFYSFLFFLYCIFIFNRNSVLTVSILLILLMVGVFFIICALIGYFEKDYDDY